MSKTYFLVSLMNPFIICSPSPKKVFLRTKCRAIQCNNSHLFWAIATCFSVFLVGKKVLFTGGGGLYKIFQDHFHWFLSILLVFFWEKEMSRNLAFFFERHFDGLNFNVFHVCVAHWLRRFVCKLSRPDITYFFFFLISLVF